MAQDLDGVHEALASYSTTVAVVPRHRVTLGYTVSSRTALDASDSLKNNKNKGDII